MRTQRKEAVRAGRPPLPIRWAEVRKLADAGVGAADIEAVLNPPDLSSLPAAERVRREAELGEARLRAELQTTARAKALGRGKVARKVSAMLLLAQCRARLGWDRQVTPETEPPDLDGAKQRLRAIYEKQRANLQAQGAA